jgi:hypothetical protein
MGGKAATNETPSCDASPLRMNYPLRPALRATDPEGSSPPFLVVAFGTASQTGMVRLSRSRG